MRVASCASILIAAALWVPPASAAPSDDRAKGDAAIAARRVLVKYCGECHGDDTGKLRGRLNVFDRGSVVASEPKVPFVNLEKVSGSQILQFIEDGSMPPGQRPRPTKAEVADLERWAQAQAPMYPARFDDETVLRLVVEDLEKSVPAKDRGAFRYLSLAHRVETEKPDLAATEAELAAALGKPDEAFGRVLKPLAKSANTVYRLDLKELRWNATGLFDWVRDDKAVDDEFPIVPFDLLQLEYPYSFPKAADKDLAERVKRAVEDMNPHRRGKPLEQLRAVPYLRADWLVKALRKEGKPTPLAAELTALSQLAALDPTERGKDPPPGPPPKPFVGGEPGPAASPWAWYQAGVPEGKSEVGLKVENATGGRLPAGGGNVQLRAVAAQTVHVTLVDVGTDDLVRVLPVKKAKLDPDKPVNLSNNEKGTIFVAQPKSGGASIYYLVFAAIEEPKAPPVVVRSRHAAPGIWRVLPSEQDSAADSKTLPVARAVVRIEFKKEE